MYNLTPIQQLYYLNHKKSTALTVVLALFTPFAILYTRNVVTWLASLVLLFVYTWEVTRILDGFLMPVLVMKSIVAANGEVIKFPSLMQAHPILATIGAPTLATMITSPVYIILSMLDAGRVNDGLMRKLLKQGEE